MEDKMKQIQELLSLHTVEEILKLNLLKFFNLEDKYTLEELQERYEKEEFNEINHPLKYFKENIIDLKNNMEKYLWVYNILLTEEKSKIVFVNMLYAKVFMSVSNTEEAYSSEMMYYDKTIWGELSNETYVDCGGYIGDTAYQFISKCPNYKKVFIYEPLPELAQICAKHLDYFIQEGNLVVNINAVYERKEQLHFAQELGAGDSYVKDGGELTVQAISLDEEIEEPISFIKMDIEGSEKSAILGSRNHIKNDNPKMAICIYHLMDDFWKIPEIIYNINPNYNFIIRHHLINGFTETVLYCVPKIKGIETDIIEDDETSYLHRYKNIIEIADVYNEEENKKVNRLIKDKSWFLFQLRNYNQNIDGKEKNILELKEWTKELNNGKKYLDNRATELEQWTKELQKGKEFLEEEISNYKSRATELEQWTRELQKGKNYLEEQCNKVNNENIKANQYINDLENKIIELKNNNSKLQYKFNKIANDTFVKKIIKWKKYDV